MGWLGDVVDTAKSVVDNDYVRAATAAVAPVLSLNLESGRIAAQHPELVGSMVVPSLIAQGVFARTVIDPEYSLGFWARLKGSAVVFSDYTHEVTRNQWVQIGSAGLALVYPPAGVPLCVGLAAADALAAGIKRGDAESIKRAANTVDLAAGGNVEAERAAEMIVSAEAAIDAGTTLVDQFWASAPEGVTRPDLYLGGEAHQDLDLGPLNTPAPQAPVSTGPSAEQLAKTRASSAAAASKAAGASRAAEAAWKAEQEAQRQKALADATSKMIQARQEEADIRFAEDVMAMSGSGSLVLEMLDVDRVRQTIASAQAIGSALPVVTFRMLTNGRIEQVV